MRSAKRLTWAVLSAVIGFGLLAILGALAFFYFGKPRPVNPGAAVSEMIDKVDPSVVRIGAVGTGPTPVRPQTPAEIARGDRTPSAGNGQSAAAGAGAAPGEPGGDDPAVIVLAALPSPTTTGSPTAPEPTATAAAPQAAVTAIATTSANTAANTGAAPSATEGADPSAADEPPPGARQGVTYCGATTCLVGTKCCCDICVPFEQACDPRSCAAQSGLSISVACGMDLCDPGEICCDAHCGECARAGECPEEPCR